MRYDLFRFSVPPAVPHVAILISRSDLGTHTGIIFRGAGGNLERMDFCMDGRIACGGWSGRHNHVIPNVDDDALENLASLCRVIAGRYRNRRAEHRYGFSRDPGARADPITGILNLGAASGATCASFVLIVFSSAGIELVDPVWPRRPHLDDPNHQRLITILGVHGGVDGPYISRVRKELPCPRVAPEEVAGSGMYPDLQERPADQEFADRAGQWIMDVLEGQDWIGR